MDGSVLIISHQVLQRKSRFRSDKVLLLWGLPKEEAFMGCWEFEKSILEDDEKGLSSFEGHFVDRGGA